MEVLLVQVRSDSGANAQSELGLGVLVHTRHVSIRRTQVRSESSNCPFHSGIHSSCVSVSQSFLKASVVEHTYMRHEVLVLGGLLIGRAHTGTGAPVLLNVLLTAFVGLDHGI